MFWIGNSEFKKYGLLSLENGEAQCLKDRNLAFSHDGIHAACFDLNGKAIHFVKVYSKDCVRDPEKIEKLDLSNIFDKFEPQSLEFDFSGISILLIN